MAKSSGVSTTTKLPVKQILTVILVVSLVGNGILLWQYTESQNELSQTQDELAEAEQTIDLFKTDPEQAQQASVEEYVEQVGQVYDLPSDETPTVATVREKELLDEQPFFARAENGDVVLIYPESELAILYRPSTNQLVNVSSLAIDDDTDALDIQDEQVESSGLDTE